MMGQGMQVLQPNPYAYSQPGGVVNPMPNLGGMSKYPQGILTSSSPMPQTTASPFNMPQNYMTPSPNPMASGNFPEQMYFNKGQNASFLTGSTPSFPSSGLSSMDTSFSSNIEYGNPDMEKEFEKIVENIANLKNPEKREEALQELSKKREGFPALARLLWYSVGTVAIL